MWFLKDQMIWQISQKLDTLAYLQRLSMAKNPNQVQEPEYRKYPWTNPNTQHFGHVEPEDQEAAVDYLLGLQAG